jgi:serine phosphatase RsbU (regulator of sigma subunit)
VAGDFYDVLHHSDGSIDLVIADVAGKGFAASLIMASVKAMLPFVTSDSEVAESLSRLNQRLALELGRGEFVALCLARYRPRERVVEVANAGAPDPYLLRPGQHAASVSVPGPRLPLGIRTEVAYASRKVEVRPDDRLLLLTDGLPEARGADGEPMGYQALESMLDEHPATDPPAPWLSGLFDRVQRRTGRVPEDDWTAAMLGPLAQESTAAHRQRRSGAALAGWVTFSCCVLVLAAAQFFLHTVAGHGGVIMVVAAAMVVATALYWGRTDFTR